MRCDGRGVLSIRTGIPGSTRGYVPGTIVEEGPGYNVRKGSYYDNTGDFEGPPEATRCPVCLGTGWRSVRTPKPDYGGIYPHASAAEGLSLEEMLPRMGVSDANAEEESP
jgi:hypothetical protein